MAEQLNKAEIIPGTPTDLVPQGQGDGGRYRIEVTDFGPSGRKESFSVALPENEKWGSVMLRAALLKRTTWKTFEIPTILHAVMYADQMGLDIMAGDVYMAEEGRLSTTAGAKIRHAMASDRIVGYKVEMEEGPEVVIPWETRSGKGEYRGPNLKATVTVKVKGWDEPVVYKTTLKEWFVGRNPNWRTRPEYMLRRNALSKALEEVAPMGVEPEEAPPVERPSWPGGYGGPGAPPSEDLVPQLRASIAAQFQKGETK